MRTLNVQAYNCNNANVVSATGVTKLLDKAERRLGASIYNDSTAVLTVTLGTAAQMSGGEITTKLAANGGYYEVPFGYVGEVYGQWASANGFARVADFS